MNSSRCASCLNGVDMVGGKLTRVTAYTAEKNNQAEAEIMVCDFCLKNFQIQETPNDQHRDSQSPRV